MSRRAGASGAVASAVVVAVLATFVFAQERTADVRTRSGQTWRLTDPSLHVLFTVMPKPEGEPGLGTPPAGGPPAALGGAGMGASVGGGPQPQLIGSPSSLKKALATGPEPLRAQRASEVITVVKDDVEILVPFASIAALAISRVEVANSTLPPYVAPTHVRYTAAVALVDGSVLEGTYVNLGTTVLRGISPQGRVELSLEDIESLRFAP
jgi:hypothetical protein